MEFYFCKPTGLLELFLHVPKKPLKVVKSLLILSGLILISSSGFSQSSNLSFSQIPLSDPDMNRPFGGAEQWNGQNTVNIPTAGTNTPRLDAYYRFSYADICPYNSPANTYDWSMFDNRINDAISKGQKFSFSVMPLCNMCSQGGQVNGAHLFYPLYLHYQMQAESVKDFQSGGEWIPNWNSPSWLNAWKNLYIAINNHLMSGSFNGVAYKNVINYVDISGYGEYGEWTNNDFSGPTGSKATDATLKSIIDYSVLGLPNFRAVALVATFDGNILPNTQVSPAVGYYALTIKNNAGLVGWRRENWGWTDWYNSAWTDQNKAVYNGMRFDTAITNRYKYAPVVGEPADLGYAVYNGQAFGDLNRQIQFYHVASFGNGNLDRSLYDVNAQNNFRTASKSAGYRLVLSGGTMTTTLAAGSAFNLSLNWQNIGAAPTYENWNVVFELRNGSGAVVWTSNSSFTPTLFAPSGTAKVVSDNFTLPLTVASGTYSMYMIVKDPVNFRKPLPLAITGRNSDGSYLIRNNITVNKGGNIPPTANAGPDQVIQLPTSSATLSGSGTDTDGSIASYTWNIASGPAGSTITATGSASTTITGLVQGVYQLTLSVKDNAGATSLDTVKITVNAAVANKNPVAKAGADITITLPTSSTTLNGSGSSDPDGTIASYAWVKIGGPSQFVIASSNAATTAVSSLTAGIYDFQLKVTDDKGLTALDTVKVIVNAAPVNRPPVANAGANISITLPTSTASLNGSASSDPDGSLSGYAWTQISGPGTATIAAPGTATTAISGLVKGTYSFQLKVTDNSGATGLDSVQVTVNAAANQPPVANPGNSRSITLPVNSTTLDGSLSTDADGTITSYGWAQVSGPSTAGLSAPSSAVSTASGLIAGQYVFELSVQDNAGAVSKAQVKVTVTAAGTQPPVANAGADQSITLPVNSATIDGSASTGSITSYTWTEQSGPSTVSLSNTAINTLNNLVAGTYIFRLTVKDNASATSTDSVIIRVNAAVNKAPVANAGPSLNISLPVNSAQLDGTQSYDPDGTIAAYSWSMISGPNTPALTGGSTAQASVSNLAAGQYTFQLTVTDNAGATASAQVKINVGLSANQLPLANAGSNQTITLPVNSVGLDGTASSDPDGSIKSYNWATVSGPGSVTISNSNTANPTATGLQTGVYVFELTVTDDRGGVAKDQTTVTVYPKPVVPNQAPVANAGNNITLTLPVNSTALNGTSSFDADGTITAYSWSMVSGPNTPTITGVNTTQASVSNLAAGQYIFELTVTDNNSATNTDQVTVTVNAAVAKANIPPTADAGPSDTLILPTSTYILNASRSTDPDGTIASYQWRQVSGPNTAVSSAMSMPQVSLSNLVQGEYQFEVTVTDNGGATSSASMKLVVNDALNFTDRMSIFPNPAHDVIHSRIFSSVTGTVRIFIYDMSGKLVLETSAVKTGETLFTSFAVSQLSGGVYTMQVVIGNRTTLVSKFIKN